MNYTYPKTYQPASLTEQGATLIKHFKLDEKLFPLPIDERPPAEAPFLIPHWTLLGKTYEEALERVFKAIASTRNFVNYREGELGAKYLRETEAKKKAFALYENKVILLPAQFGLKYRGESVETVRKNYEANEVGLGAYEVAIMLLTNPSRLQDCDDLWIDCPDDEFAPDGGGRFVSAPCFGFGGGDLGFDAGRVSDAGGRCGSASGVLSQYPLETRPLDSFDPLILRIEKLKTIVEQLKNALYEND